MITSTSNNQVRYLVQLQTKARARRERGEFVVEGMKMIEEAPKDRIVKIYASESFEKCNGDFLGKIGMEYESVSDHVFAQMSDTQTPQGILAVMRMTEYSMQALMGENPMILLVENLQDPGNLGTIIRTAEGAGVTGILMNSNTVDIYNPKTIRSTMGSIFRVPFLYENKFLEAVDELKEKGIQIFAAHLEGKGSYVEEDYRGGIGFMIGNEGNGLTYDAVQKADTRIRIPMCGKVESLNAAIAATILLYEAKRQRDI